MAVSAELQILITAVNNAKAQITSLVKDLSGVSAGVDKINGKDIGTKQNTQLKELGANAKSATDSMGMFALKAAAAVVAIRGLIAIPETYKQIDARLRIAADSQADYNRSQEETTRIALASRSSLEGVAGLYTKLRVNARLASDDAARLTEIIGKATQLDGGGAGADAAIFQLQQGLSSGTLRGEELNSVLEQTPSLAKALADGLGVSVGGLRQIAQDGKLTAEVVRDSLFKMQGDVESKFNQLPVTTGQAFENIKTKAILAIGSIDQQLGITSTIAKGIQAVADNLEPIIKAGAIVGAIFVGLKVQALIASSGMLTLAGATGALGVVMAAVFSPVTLVIGAFAGLIKFFTDGINASNALTETVAEEVTVWEVFGAVLGIVGDSISNVIGFIGDLTGLMPVGGKAIDEFGKQNEKTWTESGGFARNFFNGIVGFLPMLGRALAATAVLIKEGISQLFSSIADEARALGKDLQNVLKGDLTFSNLIKSGADSKKAFSNLGKQYAENMKDALDAGLGTDYAADIFKSINSRINEERKKKPIVADKPASLLPEQTKKGSAASAFGLGQDEINALKTVLDGITNDIKSSLAQASKIYDESYKDNLISINEFYIARQGIIDKQADTEIEAERTLLSALQAERAKVANTAVGDKEQEKKRAKLADIDNEIFKIGQKVLQIDKERGFATSDIARNRERDSKALREQLADIRLANDLVAGVATSEQRADAIRLRNAELLRKAQENESENKGATAAVERKIEIEINQETLDRTETEFNAVMARLRASQETVDIQRKNGILTETQAREQLVILNRQAADDLDVLIPKLEEAAKALGPEAQARVAEWRNQIAQTRLVVDETAVRINGAFKDGASTLFKDLITGAKNAKEAVLDFANTFLKAVADVASQKLTDSIFGGVAGGGGGIGGILSGLFGDKPKEKGSNPADPLYVQDASKATEKLGDVVNPTEGVLDTFFTKVKTGFNSLVDIGSNVFKQIGGFISNLFSSTGGSGGGGMGSLFGSIAGIFGFAEGGYVSGAGTGTSDSIVAKLSNGEHVTRASQTAKWLPLLNAINSGAIDSMSGLFGMSIPTRPYFAGGGLVDTAAQAGGQGTQASQSNQAQTTRIVNVIDPAMAGEYLQSAAGEKVLMNFITRNKSGVKSAIS